MPGLPVFQGVFHQPIQDAPTVIGLIRRGGMVASTLAVMARVISMSSWQPGAAPSPPDGRLT